VARRGHDLLRAVLRSYGVNDRNVWVADSFEGLPPPNAMAYPEDKGDTLFQHEVLRVPLEQVRANFAKFGLLDDRVRFLKGWFKDTLPSAPIQHLSVLRLDGDMYESTMDGLVHLYPKVSVGGYVIVDDYGCIPACRRAVQDYREKHGVSSEIREVDWTCVYWKKSSTTATN
jgi:O-methyltransferase